jgi:hypothetical protein
MALKAVVEKLDDVPEAFRELYAQRGDKFEIVGIEGMKTQADVDRLTTALTKERTDHKQTREKFAPFADMNIEEVHAKLDRIPELEAAAAGKLDEKKLNELVEARLVTKVAPLNRELETLRKTVGEKDITIQNYTAKEKRNAISAAVTAAARKAGLQDTAIDDAVLLAERVFELGDDGQTVTAKDGVGCTPGIDPVVWFSEMQTKRPHWWGPSKGGGAGGGSGNSGPGLNPWSHANWNMTEQARIYKESPARADQLAKSAGTTIGGQKPAASK